MSWKTLPGWLKGGLYGILFISILIGIVYLLSLLFSFDCTDTLSSSLASSCSNPLIYIIGLPSFPALYLIGALNLENLYLMFGLLGFYYFFIGAIIGAIVRKIKMKRIKTTGVQLPMLSQRPVQHFQGDFSNV